MKKLSVIIALCLVLTIGGVYATFSYATENVDSKSGDVGITLAQAVTDTPKGTINMLLTDNPGITIDDAGYLEKGDGYQTYVVGGHVNGTLKLSFTPNSGSGTTHIKVKVTVTTSFENSYNDDGTNKRILNLSEYTNDALLSEITIPLSDLIQINGDITLSTYNKYQNYSDALGNNPTITITVEEVE